MTKRIAMAVVLAVFVCAGSTGLISLSEQKVFAEETGVQDADTAPAILDDSAILQMKAIVVQVYARNFWLPAGDFTFTNPLIPVQLKASEMQPEERTAFLYWYVSSHFAKEDPRILLGDSDIPPLYGVPREKITEMIQQLTGSAEEQDVQVYIDKYCEMADDTAAYVYGQTGGQYSGCRLSEESEITEENGRIKISGKIENDNNSEGQYTIYCVPKEGGFFGGYVFDELIVTVGEDKPEEAVSGENGAVATGEQAAKADWLTPDSIWATSVHYTEGVDSYEPQRINDGDVTTGWVEGVDGPGIGEYIELTYPAGIEFRSVWIVPGFCKREDLFYRNNVPVELEFSSGENSVTVNLSSMTGDFYQAVEGKEFLFPKGLPCDGTLRVTIRNVLPGSEWDDTVISELKMSGK